jgi:cAMP-binding proteins - catabolite gene activator and regulatory subunit of cAMP-dependent protein kinases
MIDAGKIDDSIYFLRKGVCRAYIDRNGEEQTLWFAVPGEYVFSSWGLKGLPSRLTISASSDSEALELRKSTIEKMTIISPAIAHWLQELFIDLFITSENALVDIWSPKAEDRYLSIMKKMPELFQNVPLQEIAGFIGVTPQSLSRIRAGLNKNKK